MAQSSIQSKKQGTKDWGGGGGGGGGVGGGGGGVRQSLKKWGMQYRVSS